MSVCTAGRRVRVRCIVHDSDGTEPIHLVLQRCSTLDHMCKQPWAQQNTMLHQFVLRISDLLDGVRKAWFIHIVWFLPLVFPCEGPTCALQR